MGMRNGRGLRQNSGLKAIMCINICVVSLFPSDIWSSGNRARLPRRPWRDEKVCVVSSHEWERYFFSFNKKKLVDEISESKYQKLLILT